MTMFREEVAIDFTELGSDNVKAEQWLRDTRLSASSLDDMIVTVDVEIDISQFADDDIRDEFERRFLDLGGIAPGIYRLMAQGDIAEAMDEMSRAFDLAPPSHQKRIADRIAAGRAKESASRQGDLHDR